jgi:hypothetical protein
MIGVPPVDETWQLDTLFDERDECVGPTTRPEEAAELYA